jgi:predicted regulator of Ras-like GTPase activity (Roadblock/LC7/MglB family)
MAIPFLSYFKKKAKPEPVAASAPIAPLEKKSSERLSKTVMPSAPRSVSPSPMTANSYAPAAVAPATVAPRTVSFAGAASARSADLPPAVALALEPNVERTISLELADIINQMPQGIVRPLDESDASRRVLLKASELERGMANGKPAVSLASIYEQVPEIFTQTVAPSDNTQIALPFSVVLEQFSNLQTRSDQQRQAVVPQVETPFLRVTLEDNARFGNGGEMPEIADLPTVRVQPATAEAIAAAEPEPAAKETLMSMPPPKPSSGKPFSLRPAGAPAPAANGASAAPTAAPARIPFKLTPNGTDAPAPERVPASSGPSVPTSTPAPTASPTRIPFKVTAPSEDARPKAEPWLTKANFAAEPDAQSATASSDPTASAPASAHGATVSLALKPILEALPPMQLAGAIDDVSSDARIELPVAMVEPQLVSGRVSIAPDQFAAALPEEYRGLFNASETAVPVSLPLQEVLKSLPSALLRMRDDQEEQEKGANFETPFSTKAQEDAKRFNVAASPIAKPVVAAPEAVAEPAPAIPERKAARSRAAKQPEVSAPVSLSAKTAPGERSALQTAFDTDDELDAKAVVSHVGKMEGVKACAIMFGDGLSLAGNLPKEYEAEGLCAMAPALLQRVANHMVETKLGGLRAMTLSCAKAAVTFFMHENLCLAALHAKEELTADIRERLGHAVQELSRQYSHPA